MNIYLVTAPEDFGGYDSYDSFVVACNTEQEARETSPSATHHTEGKWMGTFTGGSRIGQEYSMDDGYNWPRFSKIDSIEVELLGKATEGTQAGVILTSFNAG